MKTAQSNTRWWWKKRTPTPITKKSLRQTSTRNSVHSTVNGADEDASIFTLYSYAESLVAPPSIHNRASSSLYVQHTKSEYSANYSDVESNASIMSKPWTSQEIIITTDNKLNEEEEDEAEEEKSLYKSNLYAVPQPSASLEPAKRRGSLVDFIVNSKIKVKSQLLWGIMRLTFYFFT